MKTHLILIVALCFMMSGCLDSEGDYQQLLEEKNALVQELDLAQKENEILNHVLADVTKEREILLATLNPQSAPVALDDGTSADPASASSVAMPTPSGKYHVVGKQDYLSKIAVQYGTNIGVLLELNPQIKTRRDYFVSEGERINLP